MRLQPSAHQAQDAKQNGLEICCAIIGGQSGIGSKRLGGLPPFENSGLRKIFSVENVASAEIGWIEVALLSLRIAGGMKLGIGRGKIVDEGGDLGARTMQFVGNSVGK